VAPPPDQDRDERVLILAPRGKDAVLAHDTLLGVGIRSHVCGDLQALADEIAHGAGALLIAEEAIGPSAVPVLFGALRDEPSWSDLPIVVLLAVSSRDKRAHALPHLDALRNVTMLDRPVRIAALVSTLQSALRARRRQYEIRDLMAELQRALQVRDELLASVSHELRTPLNVILGWTSTLQRRMESPERIRDAVTIVERNSRMLWQLVEDLIDVSRIASGRVQLRMAAVDVGAVARAGVETLLPSAYAKHVALTCAVADHVPDVRGDEVRLQQVIWNLVCNALKFTTAGGRIDVKVRRAGDSVEIVVADTGIGIDPGFLPHVFEPFRQGTPSNSDPNRGLGLGLAIVRHLIELHGGTIDAHSEGVGRGSRFSVRLPAASADESVSSSHLSDERNRAAV
jgi:signal transduction histidine kinase